MSDVIVLTVDGNPLEYNEATWQSPRLMYDVQHPRAVAKKRESGPAGFCVNLRVPSGTMDSYMKDQHVLNVITPDSHLSVVVSFKKVATEDEEDWVFGKPALGCPVPGWVHSDDEPTRWEQYHRVRDELRQAYQVHKVLLGAGHDEDTVRQVTSPPRSPADWLARYTDLWLTGRSE